MDNCQNCKFFLPQDEAQGLCRRSPPTLFLLPDQSTISLFPPMLNDGACGEYEEK